MFESKKAPGEIVKEKGLAQISDESAIIGIIEEVLAQNPAAVEDFRAGKEKAMGFLTGQAMRASRGKANPGVIQKLLREALEKLK